LKRNGLNLYLVVEKLALTRSIKRFVLLPSIVGYTLKMNSNQGKLTARERLNLLLDNGSFREYDAFVEHQW
jgi:acetyl-CoA carboxylase carboxyltransferase component